MKIKAIFRTIAACAFISLAIFATAQEPLRHTLEKGETLYSISRKYKVSYEALASANGISDPTKLKVGTVLIIPSVHVVSKGETLYGISKQYGITIAELLSSNKLTAGYVLKIGDVLIVPGTAVKAPSPSTTPPAAEAVTLPIAPGPTTLASGAASASASTTSTSLRPPSSPTTTIRAPAAKTATPVTIPPAPPTYVPMPDPVKTQDRAVDMKLNWPVQGKAMYLDGKLEGVMIRVKSGETAKAIASGTVVSAGPSRGFSQVAFIQAKSGYVYVYGGNETLFVKTGDQITSGKEIGRIGMDAKDGSPIAYFFVFRNGQPIDPAQAPRD